MGYHCLFINMKLIVLIAVVALASARPDVLEEKKPNVAIISSSADGDLNGNYKFNFETEDGVKRDQEGSLKQITDEGAVASGSYSYTDPDGNVVSLSFVADENGFQPTGDHLPKPHPAIVRALEQIRRTNEADAKRAAGHHHHA